jgi:hypothetical protein
MDSNTVDSIFGALFFAIGLILGIIITTHSRANEEFITHQKIKPELRIEVINGVADTLYVYKRNSNNK